MKSGKSTTNLTAQALLWAAAMIGSALIVDTEHSKDVFLLLITLSTTSFLMIEENRESIIHEWKCIQRRFTSK